jgi:hypothetical protein
MIETPGKEILGQEPYRASIGYLVDVVQHRMPGKHTDEQCREEVHKVVTYWRSAKRAVLVDNDDLVIRSDEFNRLPKGVQRALRGIEERRAFGFDRLRSLLDG